MQKLLGSARKAIDKYNMIADGDRIAVGVSGGKDSLALLYTLSLLRRFYPKKFSLTAITLDLGYENSNYEEIEDFCRELAVDYIIEKTQIKQIVFDIRKEKNPCSLCANLRRGALNNAAIANGCNCVALGHHSDDAIETFMLSLIYEGRINCFSPLTFLENTKLKLIRPLIFSSESYISSVSRRLSFPVFKNPCPADKHTKREEIKKYIASLCENDKKIKSRIFTAIQTGSFKGWNEEHK